MFESPDLGLAFDAVGAFFLALSAPLVRPRRFDPLSAVLVAAAAGLAGGAVRDVLIGAPPGFVRSPLLAGLVVVAGGLGVALSGAARLNRAVPVLDAAALAVLAVAGCAKAAAFGLPPLSAVLVGALSGVAGGLVRDLALGRAPRLVTSKFYGSAAVLGAALYILLRLSGAGDEAALALGVTGAFAGRLGAVLARPSRRSRVVGPLSDP